MMKKHTLNLEKFWVYRWQWRDLVVFAAALSRLNVAYWTPLQRRYAHCAGAILTVYRDGVTLLHRWKIHSRSLFVCRDIWSRTSYLVTNFNTTTLLYIRAYTSSSSSSVQRSLLIDAVAAAATHRNAGLCSQHVQFQHVRFKGNRQTGAWDFRKLGLVSDEEASS